MNTHTKTGTNTCMNTTCTNTSYMNTTRTNTSRTDTQITTKTDSHTNTILLLNHWQRKSHTCYKKKKVFLSAFLEKYLYETVSAKFLPVQ